MEYVIVSKTKISKRINDLEEFIERSSSSYEYCQGQIKALKRILANSTPLIDELQKYVEHPNKPGYKRSDIVARIQELKLDI